MIKQSEIHNPILRGFNPDPSIVRTGNDYYIATSTFEWYPGIQIHHSSDLINWKLITRPLSRISQLSLLGVPDSCGIWAPCLSYKLGTYYLTYSLVRSFAGVTKDLCNYVVTATDIMGPWSDPVYLNSSGFDPSMFHDHDGRSYLLNMLMDPRDKKLFGGIILQEFDTQELQLTGDSFYLHEGTKLGSTEGPHIYRRNNYYYLLLAEGGTGYDHAVSILRASSITGPYEPHPNNPIVSARDHPDNYLQKAGHADLVESVSGQWYAVFLCARPLSQRGRCTLGRESAITPIKWDNDWPYIAANSKAPDRIINIPGSNVIRNLTTLVRREITFASDKPLDINLQSLRRPISTDWADLTARPGCLRMTGRESLSSTFDQSLLGHRLEEHVASAVTILDFQPTNRLQTAGLACYYNTGHYHYLCLRGDDSLAADQRKYLTITSCDNFDISEPIGQGIQLPMDAKIWLKAVFNYGLIQFFYATVKNNWIAVGPELDGSILSDDYVAHHESYFHPCFTGAFFVICCQDLSRHSRKADFEQLTIEVEKPD